jgi:hypothetical protein
VTFALSDLDNPLIKKRPDGAICHAPRAPRRGLTMSIQNSLFSRTNSLSLQKISLFCCVGKLAESL